MKKAIVCVLLVVMLAFVTGEAAAQCSICTGTAAQLGEKPAKGLNAGILYLAFTPLLILGYVGYRWWKREREIES